MKRIIAMGLALAMCCGLFVTAVFAEEENGTAGDAQAVTEEQAGTDAAAGSAGSEGTVEGEQTAGEAPAGNTVDAAEGENAGPDTPDVPEPDAVGTLSYANLEKRVRENNLTMLALSENIASIDAIDLEKMENNLRDNLNAIQSQIFQLRPLTQYDSSVSLTISTLQETHATLKATFDDLVDGKTQRTYDGIVMQLENARNQMVMGAESLYVALLEMQNSLAGLQRQLAALDRTVQEMELRYSMGQISALTLQQVKSGRASLASGIATLELNIGNYTAQLENMVGAEITGKLSLGEVPAVTDAQIAAMDMEKDLETSKANSYELFNARTVLNDAEDTWEDVKDQYKGKNHMRISGEHAWKAAQYTYESTIQSYELRFHTMFNTVADHRQILTAQETALELQRNAYRAAELKYQQGTISQNALLEAQDALVTAENSVTTAKHNLFTAYRTYCWAVNYGVLN